jgi:hypothetical protein
VVAEPLASAPPSCCQELQSLSAQTRSVHRSGVVAEPPMASAPSYCPEFRSLSAWTEVLQRSGVVVAQPLASAPPSCGQEFRSLPVQTGSSQISGVVATPPTQFPMHWPTASVTSSGADQILFGLRAPNSPRLIACSRQPVHVVAAVRVSSSEAVQSGASPSEQPSLGRPRRRTQCPPGCMALPR